MNNKLKYVNVMLLTLAIILGIISIVSYTGIYSMGYATGDSNEPYMDNGTIIVKDGVNNINNIEEGDIISYEPDCYMFEDSDYIVHMVIDKRENRLITMGMNNSQPDQVVYYDESNDYDSISDHIRNIDNATVHSNSCQSMITNESINGKVIYHTNQTDLVNIVQTIRG